MEFNYEREMESLFKEKDNERNYKAVVIAVTNVELLSFLKTQHPNIWDEFKEFVHKEK